MSAVPGPAFDVLVAGAGPVGAALAALLVQRHGFPAARVGLLDPRFPAATAAGETPDLRVSALARSSQRVLEAAGAWPAVLAAGVSPYEAMHVWHASVAPRSAHALRFEAAELPAPDLGCIVENRRVQRAALAAFEAAGGRRIEGELVRLDLDARQARITTADGREFGTRLLVGTDGAQSRVRALAGLAVEVESYRQEALVANVRPERAHERTAWQRFLGRGTLALLPLADGQCSIVWSLPEDEARRLLAAPAGEFEALLERDSDGVLGRLALASPRLALPLRRLSAAHYVLERCAIAGDAAHTIHPLAGQGVNLGLLDVAVLAEELAAARNDGEDPGALRVLRRYERRRRGANELMSLAMDGFNRFLATGSDTASVVVQRGMSLVGQSALARGFFMRRALGLDGDLPVVAESNVATRRSA